MGLVDAKSALIRCEEIIMVSCPICECEMRQSISKNYLACQNCRHEILASGQNQTIMVNDDLDFKAITKGDINVRAQLKCLSEVKVGSNLLIDVGCGSGKFLYHAQNRFSEVLGVEISKKSAKFAIETLGLRVATDLPVKIDGAVSVVTFWHSLEHIPEENLQSLLGTIHSICGTDSKIIISVPNADSFQYKFFKEGFAYYDVPNHLHQFTTESLDRLMKQADFAYISDHKMPSYDLFGYIQGLVNNFISPNNFLYYVLKRKYKNKELMEFRRLKIFFSILLSGIFFPIAIILTICDQLAKGRASVITRCYQKSM